MISHTGTCMHHPLTGRSGELAGQCCDLLEGTSLCRRKDRKGQWFGPFLNLVPEKKIAQTSIPLVKHCPLSLFPVLIVLSISLLNIYHTLVIHHQIRSVAQSCPTLCGPMNRSTPGFPVHHQLLEFTETHVHRVSDAIQPSHPLSSPSPPAPNPSQHQSLFQ